MLLSLIQPERSRYACCPFVIKVCVCVCVCACVHVFAGHSDGPRCPYYTRQVVLDDFSLTIPAGKVTALCGLSGAGQLRSRDDCGGSGWVGPMQ